MSSTFFAFFLKKQSFEPKRETSLGQNYFENLPQLIFESKILQNYPEMANALTSRECDLMYYKVLKQTTEELKGLWLQRTP